MHHQPNTAIDSAMQQVEQLNGKINHLNNSITQGQTKYDLALSSMSQIKSESISLYQIDNLDGLKNLFNLELNSLKNRLTTYQESIAKTLAALEVAKIQHGIDASILNVDINALSLERLAEYEAALVRNINDLNGIISNMKGQVEANRQQLDRLLEEANNSYGTSNISELSDNLQNKQTELNVQLNETERSISSVMHEMNSHE